MCGVFGYVSSPERRPNLDRLRRIALATERRGPHAFGFAWIDSRGRLKMFKQTGRISDHLGLLTLAADARMLIGHCRYATHGDYRNNLNNHPHAADGGWIVHNGQIPNHEQLILQRDLWPVTDCDSELLGLMIEQGDGTLAARCGEAVAAIHQRPAVLLGLWAKPARLVVVRSGNPLRIGSAASGVYLASLTGGMPRNARHVPDESVIEIRHDRQGNYHATQKAEQVREARPRSGRTPALWA